MALSDASRFRQVAAGWSLRLGPLLLAVSALLAPPWASDDEAMLLAGLDADRDEALVAILLGLGGTVLCVPALLGLMHMLRERLPAAGHVAGVVALAGAAGLGLRYTVELVVWQMAQAPEDRLAGLALLERLRDESLLAIGFGYLPLLLAAGTVALAVALRSASAVEPWTAYFLVIGASLAGSGLGANAPTLVKVGLGFVLAASNKIGVRVLAQDEDDWTHWPAWSFTWSWRR